MNKNQCFAATFFWRMSATACLCMLFASSSIFAQVYESVDSQGNKTYSDSPGPGKTSVDLNNQNLQNTQQNTEQQPPTNTPQNPPEIVTGGNPTPGTVVPTATTGAFPATTVPPGVIPPGTIPPLPPQPGNPTTTTTKSNIPEANIGATIISTPPAGTVPSIPNQTVIPGQTNPNETRGQTSIKTGTSAQTTGQANTPAVSYTAIILSPIEGQTFQNSAQSIPLELSISPPLVPGDTIAVLVDGNQVLESPGSAGIKLPWLERGPHSVQIVIHQKNGPGVSSDTINFYQQRSSSLLKPK